MFYPTYLRVIAEPIGCFRPDDPNNLEHIGVGVGEGLQHQLAAQGEQGEARHQMYGILFIMFNLF